MYGVDAPDREEGGCVDVPKADSHVRGASAEFAFTSGHGMCAPGMSSG